MLPPYLPTFLGLCRKLNKKKKMNDEGIDIQRYPLFPFQNRACNQNNINISAHYFLTNLLILIMKFQKTSRVQKDVLLATPLWYIIHVIYR